MNSLKGNHYLAQGNALGQRNQKKKGPEGAKDIFLTERDEFSEKSDYFSDQ